MPVILRSLYRLSNLLLILGSFTLTKESRGQDPFAGLIFRDAFEVCLRAVNSGELEKAATSFQELKNVFGQEEEYRSEEIQRKILPLQGLAELGAGQYHEAAQTLEEFRTKFPDALLQNASLLYGLAQAHRGSSNLTRAREVLLTYVIQFAGTVEAGLAFLERADLFFHEQLVDEGLAAIDGFLASEAPESLKAQGRLKAVQACLQDNRLVEAT